MDIDTTGDRSTDDERMEEDTAGEAVEGDDEVMVEDDGAGLGAETGEEGDEVMEAEEHGSAAMAALHETPVTEGVDGSEGLGMPELDMRGATPDPAAGAVPEDGGEEDADADADGADEQATEKARVNAATGDVAELPVEEEGPLALRTRSHDPQTPKAEEETGEAEGEVKVEDEFYDEEDDEEAYSIDIHTLPPVLVHLPDTTRRYLFALPALEDANGQTLETPEAGPSKERLWFEGRQEELGESALANVWAHVRSELEKEGAKGLDKAELVITEPQMDLRMGEVSAPSPCVKAAC